jgi:hypothetical protein
MKSRRHGLWTWETTQKTRWFFYNADTGEFVFTLDGDPRQHPGYHGIGRHIKNDGSVDDEYPMLLRLGQLYIGRFGAVSTDDAIVCNRNCETATQPDCRCSCGGKNHGVSHGGFAPATDGGLS